MIRSCKELNIRKNLSIIKLKTARLMCVTLYNHCLQQYKMKETNTKEGTRRDLQKVMSAAMLYPEFNERSALESWGKVSNEKVRYS